MLLIVNLVYLLVNNIVFIFLGVEKRGIGIERRESGGYMVISRKCFIFGVFLF